MLFRSLENINTVSLHPVESEIPFSLLLLFLLGSWKILRHSNIRTWIYGLVLGPNRGKSVVTNTLVSRLSYVAAQSDGWDECQYLKDTIEGQRNFQGCCEHAHVCRGFVFAALNQVIFTLTILTNFKEDSKLYRLRDRRFGSVRRASLWDALEAAIVLLTKCNFIGYLLGLISRHVTHFLRVWIQIDYPSHTDSKTCQDDRWKLEYDKWNTNHR